MTSLGRNLPTGREPLKIERGITCKLIKLDCWNQRGLRPSKTDKSHEWRVITEIFSKRRKICPAWWHFRGAWHCELSIGMRSQTLTYLPGIAATSSLRQPHLSPAHFLWVLCYVLANYYYIIKHTSAQRFKLLQEIWRHTPEEVVQVQGHTCQRQLQATSEDPDEKLS
jgi:hypothetical protein